MLMEHLRAVRVLCEIDAQGSFSAAARSLGVSQSAVSQHVSSLEQRLGQALVERGTRPAGLTEAGHAVARHGRAALTRLDSAEQELAEIAGRRAGRLRFGSFPSALATFVPRALAGFRRALPGTSLTVVDDHLQRLLPRLEDGELDVALVYEHPDLPVRSARPLRSVFLLEDEFRLVLPEGHPLGSRPVTGLAALAGEPWIGGLPGAAWFRIVRESCRKAGFEPDVHFASDDYVAVQAFVAAGLGVALVPGLAVEAPLAGTTVARVHGPVPSRRVVAVRPEDAFPAPAGQAMVDALVTSTRHYRTAAPPRVNPRAGAAPAPR
jgi:molybdate transport repressor ModE-like protein